ncbi:MAG: MFS transporter [Legionellaceae bacterium]|nr:MFS transporter [Legionellaceae bacterium]
MHLFFIFLLGFSSGLPFAILSTTLIAWFSFSDAPLAITALFSITNIPYAYRVFWAPLLDRYNFSRLGKRRSIIISMQILICIGFYFISTLSPENDAILLLLLALILAFFSATQDAVIDAHRIEYLPEKLHGLGSSLAVSGYRCGLLCGGLSLIVAQHIGFPSTYRYLCLLFIPPFLATLYSKEPQHPKTSAFSSWRETFFTPIENVYQRPYFWSLVAYILLFKCGDIFTSSTSAIALPFLIQHSGFSLQEIGYIQKLLGTSAIIIGGISSGVLLLYWPLARALKTLGILQACCNLLFAFLAYSGKNIFLLGGCVVIDNLASGMASTALLALLMRLTNTAFAATQFSIFVCIAMLPRVFSGPIGTYLQQHFGWEGLYILAFFLALGFLPFLRQLTNRLGETLDDPKK